MSDISSVDKTTTKADIAPKDLESGSTKEGITAGVETTDQFARPAKSTWWAKLSDNGVELRGAEPVPVEKRTDTRYVNVLTIFATSMTSLLPIGIGSATTLGFGMSLKDAALMIVFLQFFFGLPAAYIITIAPLTGMRQMIQSRYCFGKYCNILTSVVVTLTVGGFGVVGSINGAQCLAAVHPGTLPVEGAISIIMVISLVIGFMGYRVMHFFTRWAWIPSLFAIIILVGAAGDQLGEQSPGRAHTGKDYMGMIAFTAGNMITWSNVAGDYACYMPPTAPRLRIAMYCLFGIAAPFSFLMTLGAAIGGAVFAVPAWTAAYKAGGIGAVIGNILITRLGDFGRFILVLLGLSVLATCGRDVYTISFNLPAVAPILRKVPRIILAVIATAAIIAIAIPASKSFVASVTAFLSIIGYYAGASVTCFLLEYLWFRKADPASLDPAIWDDGRALPTGLSALAAVLLSWSLIIPAMSTTWFAGPIAQKAGDLGLILAVVVAFITYLPIRTLEIKIRGRL
ncbi:permease for cytosine/purines, uracil, thiamine, allantoin-domain-containing protein [Microdochium trichocladiopsis]|uniref:Permease for cytosine/purines, uracil, thiamine, allantoin-domain-containing protein n=1 Tax=Microdochium trichocladiopsis TaxID=1682393 RepID=A0A9P9BMB9_9PEZI|nr:permease for cytosine/purines, uracil, thiamine, allantoin-domain-containing protein [Microdochium trichocladiopsis]KAH7025676.1 permease for cytosine/purines, uracil, thiamine, allantoin-domain-containing protein [Microdochium trichocladiopsis]